MIDHILDTLVKSDVFICLDSGRIQEGIFVDWSEIGLWLCVKTELYFYPWHGIIWIKRGISNAE